ncbi:MAG: hypothetical protein F4213_09470 [Boseongicola sp. SB0677_bin_26]|nr:hypothetical protein [Boseongicola sp. SB0665_bin_10]MYG26238.1 hypothetical protein [Boseongicola sp. SB0677_bin_26]
MEEFALVSGVSRPRVSKSFNDPDGVGKSTRHCDTGKTGVLGRLCGPATVAEALTTEEMEATGY